ncbi:unnamed protein product [Rhodiola kirilowii]
MDSARITDTGLARVLESNPGDYKAMCAWLREPREGWPRLKLAEFCACS